LSPYSDDPSLPSSHPQAYVKPKKFITISIAESEGIPAAEDPFSDAHAIKPEPRKSSWKLPSCIRWSLCAFVEEIKSFAASVVGSRRKSGPVGLKSLDGKHVLGLLQQCYGLYSLFSESRMPLWKGGSGAYTPLARGGAEMGVRKVNDMV
jgi:hypothetical protein